MSGAIAAERPKKRGAPAKKPAKRKTQKPAAKPLAPRAMAQAAMRAFNAVYRGRAPFEFVAAGQKLSVLPEWGKTDASPLAGAVVGFSIDEDHGELVLPPSLVEGWTTKIDPEADTARLAPEHAALLLECVLAKEIGWLETRLDCRIAITAVEGGQKAPDEGAFTFKLGRGKDAAHCALALNADWAIRLGNLLDDTQKRQPPLRLDVPASVSIWRGVTSISLAELRALQPGDIILPEEMNPRHETAVAIFADRFVAPVKAAGEGWLLIGAPRAVVATRWEWMMDHAKKPGAAAIEDSDLEDLPVTLVFELARVGMSLKEISALSPGAVVKVADVADQSVDLLANGKRIGRGEIVRIGEGLGVQVTRIFRNA
ncbi:type III secretion system cytoplasmic ring protein SctQ [Chelativorans alearense]|uniref:type III secretion system cytoplasmic ring protein SctQ n=1 Tax=Chelativorans alearense TaxID=2681495 RepID=UPI0013D10ED4|nr:type III secretion system cytoplasmic ring protein SctQ [Chelativorans alearense]